MPTFQQEYCTVNYQKFGSGTEVLIAFHGFARDSNDFKLYSELLENNYTVYAVDLFYHGKTKFDGRKVRVFSRLELKTFFDNFLSHLKIENFSLLGYSMGGRISLFVAEQFSARINELYLFAPDGLRTNFWNWMVTNTKSGKVLYGFTIKNPSWVGQMTNLGMFLKILPPKFQLFMDVNFGTAGKRLRIYRVWKLYQNININKKQLIEKIQQNNIKTSIVIGAKDPVVTMSSCKELHQNIGSNSTLYELNAGHDLFKAHVIDYLKTKTTIFRL